MKSCDLMFFDFVFQSTGETPRPVAGCDLMFFDFVFQYWRNFKPSLTRKTALKADETREMGSLEKDFPFLFSEEFKLRRHFGWRFCLFPDKL